MLDKKRSQKTKMKTGQTSPSLGFAKNKYYARVVWVEESKNSLGFEIGHNYDDVLTRSQLLTGRQSSCRQVVVIKSIDVIAFAAILLAPSNLDTDLMPLVDQSF